VSGPGLCPHRKFVQADGETAACANAGALNDPTIGTAQATAPTRADFLSISRRVRPPSAFVVSWLILSPLPTPCLASEFVTLDSNLSRLDLTAYTTNAVFACPVNPTEWRAPKLALPKSNGLSVSLVWSAADNPEWGLPSIGSGGIRCRVVPRFSSPRSRVSDQFQPYGYQCRHHLLLRGVCGEWSRFERGGSAEASATTDSGDPSLTGW
jgi:hypothetical protein